MEWCDSSMGMCVSVADQDLKPSCTMLQVELHPPYGLSNCSTENPSDLATLERVKKVVRVVNPACFRISTCTSLLKC